MSPWAAGATVMLEAGEQLSFFSRETAQQDAAHGEIEQHLAGLDQAFVVLGEPPVGGEPTDGPLHHPPSREHLKATRASRRLCVSPHPGSAAPPMLRDG